MLVRIRFLSVRPWLHRLCESSNARRCDRSAPRATSRGDRRSRRQEWRGCSRRTSSVAASIDRARAWATRVAARPTRTDRLRWRPTCASRVSRKHRQAPLKLLAVTRRAVGHLAATHERLEFMSALFARVFEQRHESIVRDRASRLAAALASRPERREIDPLVARLGVNEPPCLHLLTRVRLGLEGRDADQSKRLAPQGS